MLSSQAQAELAARELARRSLLNFVLRFETDYLAGWAHQLICAKLEIFFKAVLNNESPRLMLFLPPRFGKSYLSSIYFPAWVLGQEPSTEIIAASYAVSLPENFSRRIKQLMYDPMYTSLFSGTLLDPNAQATSGWYTTKGGAYLPSGVGTGITGRGARILIVDDPVKDAEEADSDVRRQAVWDWYSSTARTRIAPGGGVLVVQTRWSDDDLSGRLLFNQNEQEKYLEEAMKLEDSDEDFQKQIALESRSLERWEVWSFPAIATADEYYTLDHRLVYEPEPGCRLLRLKGQALHPERYDEAAYAALKRTLAPRHWSALYQQNPVPEEGAFFKKPMFKHEPRHRRDENLPVYMAWDLAIGQKQTHDFTVGVAGYVDYTGALHVIDLIKFKGDTFDIVEMILDMYQKYKPMKIGIERGHIQMAIEPVLRKQMQTRKLYPTFDEDLKPLTDKLARARPLQGLMQNGMVVFNEDSDWFVDMRSELMRFPNGRVDDTVDALSWLARIVLKEPTPVRKKDNSMNTIESWKKRVSQQLRAQNTGSGSTYMGA